MVAIATKLSEPIEAIEIDLLELKSMVDPDLADKDIVIEEVKIEL